MNRSAFKKLSPANFAFIMSTGVVSIVLHASGWPLFSRLFLFIGGIGYLALVLLFAMRIFILKEVILDDFKDIQRMFKYLTFCAGSNTLAIASILLEHDTLGIILGIIGTISTILFTYTLFCTLLFHVQKPIEAISPFWLLLSIACHSSGIVISTLWEKNALTNPQFLLLGFSFWTFGVVLYFIFMTLNIYRMIFFPFKGKDIDPCYWTCMGAAAIAVVDGSRFILVHHSPLFYSIQPFMQGMILFLWTWGAAWIPILCLMEGWKHLYFKIPFRYQPSLWAMVFPQGMFTDATKLLSLNFSFPILSDIVEIWLWVTLIIWCFVLVMSRLNPFLDKLRYS